MSEPQVELPEIRVVGGVEEDEHGSVVSILAATGEGDSEVAVELAFPNTGQVDEEAIAYLLQMFPSIVTATLEQIGDPE